MIEAIRLDLVDLSADSEAQPTGLAEQMVACSTVQQGPEPADVPPKNGHLVHHPYERHWM